MDDLEKTLSDYRKEKLSILHNAIAEMKLIDTDKEDKKYLEYRGIRYIFENGRYVGWYNPGVNKSYPLDDLEEMTRVSGLTEEI